MVGELQRRRTAKGVTLLANLLPFIPRGALLAAERGEAPWPHKVYELYWSLASSGHWKVVGP